VSAEVQFPYYIVRFKHECLPFNRTGIKLFPYYIVRFKHFPKRLRKMKKKKFPYYIVRFKRDVLYTLTEILVVSILHSTI